MDLVVGGADARPRGSSARKSRARTRRSIPGSSQDRKTFTGAAARRVSSWGEDTAEVARGEDAARSATRRAAASASVRRDASNVREADSARAVAASAAAARAPSLSDTTTTWFASSPPSSSSPHSLPLPSAARGAVMPATFTPGVQHPGFGERPRRRGRDAALPMRDAVCDASTRRGFSSKTSSGSTSRDFPRFSRAAAN